MHSPGERDSNLTSSTQLTQTQTSAKHTGHDAAASICAHLIVHNSLNRARLAHAVGLPALVIEESIKNGVSSATLRAQLRNWLYESGSSQKLRVPERLFTQLQEDCAADEIEKQEHQRKGLVSSFGVDGSPFSALDPVSQQHFTQLQKSVGQSFISILNDPGEPTANVDWTTWLGGKLYDAFDFNGRVGNLEDMIRNFNERQVRPDSTTALLTENPPNHDFTSYVKLISDAYQVNRREGVANNADEWRDEKSNLFSGAHGAGNGEASGAVDEGSGDSPWPSGVPRFFFHKEFSACVEMSRMSEAVGESSPAVALEEEGRGNAPTATTAAAAAPSAASATRTPPASSPSSVSLPRRLAGAIPSTGASGPGAASVSSTADTAAAAANSPSSAAPSLHHIVDNTTFTDDFEYLETRNKELRAWESAVEKCLLRHVKERSEDFFATSQQFGSLSSDARSVLADARLAREGGMRAGERFVAQYLRIGQLYRRRQNFVQLQLTTLTTQRVLRRLGDVENWAALPERDFGEVLAISNALVDLEATGKNVKDSDHSISWETLSRLKCLAEVPGRVKRARKALEQVVLEEYCRVLVSDLAEGDTADSVNGLCESVTRLGILNTANQLYHVKVVEALQVAAQETLVALFMNTGTLDDARANELLTVASNTVALALPDARQQLCGFAKNLRFSAYQLVLHRFVEFLVDFVTQVSQNWGFFVTGGLRHALAMYDNHGAMVVQATRDLLNRLCGEAEALVASLLEVYVGGEQVSSEQEVEQLVRLSVQFPQRVTTEVSSRLASLLQDDLPASRLAGGSSTSSAAVSTPTSPPSQRGSRIQTALGENTEPAGFLLYRPTKVIGTTVQRLAKKFFRRQHKYNMERIIMVTEGETWAAKDAVDAAIQREVEEMCATDAASLEGFRLRALRVLAACGEINGPTNGGGGYGCQRSGAPSPTRTGAAVSNGAKDSFNTEATKLYVRLPRGTGGIFSTPTSATNPSSLPKRTGAGAAASSTTSHPEEKSDLEQDGEEGGRLIANSLLVLMDLLYHYHVCISTFPFLAFDVASRMMELIDAYEAQTAAMVLGARAVEKGTLNTITAQHLCVASQCVSFLTSFIPALQRQLTAAMTSLISMEAVVRRRVPRDAVAVGCALGLIAAPSVAGEAEATSNEKAKLFIDNDWNRVIKNCRAHRNEFFSKLGSLVYRKVESLGAISVQKRQWSQGGNEWVMAMLREVARLIRALRPLLPPPDIDGVIVPLIGSLCVMLRETTMRLPAAARDDRAAAASDMMLLKANVEKFGYDVLTCAEVTSVATAMQGGRSFAPLSSEEAVLSWFLPVQQRPASPSSPRA